MKNASRHVHNNPLPFFDMAAAADGSFAANFFMAKLSPCLQSHQEHALDRDRTVRYHQGECS